MSRGGWGGFSVPGHSGTQFKHRKAFAKREYGVRSAQRTKGEITGLALKPQTELPPFWLWSIRLSVVIFAVFLIWGSVHVYQYIVQPARASAKVQMQAKSMHTDSEYETLLEIAEGELAAGQYARAIEDFERVLGHTPHNERARKGLEEAQSQMVD